MKSNFEQDLNVEAEIGKFLDEHLYPRLPFAFERQKDPGSQKQGVDIVLKNREDKLLIDEKAAIYYANQDLKTFVFELSYYINNGEVRRDGWLVNPAIKTTHYNIMWLKTKKKEMDPKEIRCEDIEEIESMMIEKERLLQHLENFGLDMASLREEDELFRGSGNDRKKLNRYMELILSGHLAEKPLNLKISKTLLRRISSLHLSVREDKLVNLKTGKGFNDEIDAMLESMPGYRAEKKVHDSIKRCIAGRDAGLFMHFPLHEPFFQGRREVDILLIDKQSGLTVIEVKGIAINQIKAVEGGDWHVENYFDKETINPFKQGENQLNLLCRKLEGDSALKGKFSKRVLVALPYISRDEWENRGFHRQMNMPPVLLKEDLQDERLMDKIEAVHIHRTGPMDDEVWSRFKSRFSIKGGESGIPEPVHSILYIFPDVHPFRNMKREIEEMLRRGVKIYLLCHFDIGQEKGWLESMNPFKDIHQLECYESGRPARSTEHVVIVDGEGALPEHIEYDFSKFNKEQYEIVHAPVRENLMVTAGAGTGKTHVIIDRIMFLLSKGVEMKDIIMITFTNKSTDEMRRRLYEKLSKLFRITGEVRFAEYAEDVKSMQINTIHSFSRSILKSLAHELGFGLNPKLRSFKQAKKEIISDLIDEFHKFHPEAQQIHSFRHYNLVDIIAGMWDEMEKKGLSEKEVKSGLDWGDVEDDGSQVFQDLFEFVFSHCETRLNEIKLDEDSLSMEDLIRKMNELSNDGRILKQLEEGKFLFVDEFQDSDNVQIKLVAGLANHLDYKLFLVGDDKQSIYRFRGADHRSFDIIKQSVIDENGDSDFLEFSLTKNYRTSKTLLDKLDVLFSSWGRRQLLNYNENLEGMNDDRGERPDELEFRKVGKHKLKDSVIEAITHSKSLVKEMPQNKNRKIALLFRRNREAEEMGRMLREAGIGVMQNLDGTFFISDAVKDFKALLDGLLYPNKAVHVINALQSPYFRRAFPDREILRFRGDDDAILSFIHSSIGDEFTKYVDQLRTLPVMAVIQKIIHEKGLFEHLLEHYKDIPEDEEAFFQARYKKNLHHLFNLIEKNFEPFNTTLYNIHRWLTWQMRVNRDENEPMMDGHDGLVEITTVHRAKGLQYHTVIIPKTDFPFGLQKQTCIIEDSDNCGGERKIGWRIKSDGYEERWFQNVNYDLLEPVYNNEVKKEETRLLYVAMTRVIERLVVLLPENSLEGTWARLIEETGIGVMNHDGDR